MRSLCLSFLFLVLSLAVLVPASWPSAAQDKTFAVSILAEHNGVRQKYDVPLLTWDDGLAKLAQDWAEKIAATGAMPPAHRASGQNLFWGTADQWSPKDVLEVWEAESKNYNRATNTCAAGKFCVHFTQVVWWTTTRVGCGKAKGTSKDGPTDFFVCDYSPPGNEVGRSPFPPPIATTTPIVTATPVTRLITPVTPAPTPVTTPVTPAPIPVKTPVTPAPTPVKTPVTPAPTPVTTPLTPAPTPVTTPVTPAPTPVATPIPVARKITSETTPTTTRASTPKTITECEDLPKSLERLTAEVEQLSKSLPTPTPTPTPEFTIIESKPTRREPVQCGTRVLGGKTLLIHNPYGIDFMEIPAGRFTMGTPAWIEDMMVKQNGGVMWGPHEDPEHEVTIKSFCMGKYEVTQAQYQAVMGTNPSYFKACGGNCPVERVSWNDAQIFIKKLNSESKDGWTYRLPTEAEWEYACRAGTTGIYAGTTGHYHPYTGVLLYGDRERAFITALKNGTIGEYAGNLNEMAWYIANSGSVTQAVGGKQPNAWGLHDMHGNVFEWCEDNFHISYNGAPTDGSAWLSGGEQKYRVLRGGSFYDQPQVVRSASRRWSEPGGVGNPNHGFRVVAVRTPKPTPEYTIIEPPPRPVSCEELRKSEQQLTARVEQLREAAKKIAAEKEEAERSAKEAAKQLREERARAIGCPANKYGIEFVKIPAGRFMMGSRDEEPVHEVTIRSFCMGEYEVTQAQWQAVMGTNPSYFKDCGGNCPVEALSWNDAQIFINKLNSESKDGWTYRLPTEAEWEYAARAGTTGDYPGNLNEIAWYAKNSGKGTHPVGGKQPNAWFLYDMHGNVEEWCEDWYHENYVGAPTDGSAWLSGGEQEERILRGGSWGSPATYLRSADRSRHAPDYRYGSFGFRVVAVPR